MTSYGQNEKVDTLRHLSEELDTIPFHADPPAEELEEEVLGNSSDSLVEVSAADDKKYFDEKGSSTIESLTDKYQPRKVPEEIIREAKLDPSFWYANADIKLEREVESVKKSFKFSPVYQNILWIAAVVGFITFLIIYLSSSNIKLFRRSGKIDSADEDSPETDDIFNINYQKEIDKALSSSNFRLATRLMFLRLLRTLSEKQIIQYTQDRTNLDYLIQLRSSYWYNDFFKVTRDYEYSWYGQFNLDRDKFNIIKKDFEGFENKLR